MPFHSPLQHTRPLTSCPPAKGHCLAKRGPCTCCTPQLATSTHSYLLKVVWAPAAGPEEDGPAVQGHGPDAADARQGRQQAGPVLPLRRHRPYHPQPHGRVQGRPCMLHSSPHWPHWLCLGSYEVLLSTRPDGFSSLRLCLDPGTTTRFQPSCLALGTFIMHQLTLY